MPIRLLSLFLIGLPVAAAAQPLDFESKGIGGGGALFSPAISPFNPNEVYLASDLGGLYHTTDAGNSYDVVHFTEAQTTPFSMVCITQSPTVRYALLYDPESFTAHPAVSVDGGDSWSFLPGDAEPWEDKLFIDADAAQPNRLIWTDYNHLFLSTDGGQTSTLAWTATDPGAGILLGGIFWSGDTILLGCNDGLVRSTNGGMSFSLMPTTGLPAGEVLIGFGSARQAGTIRFFGLTADVGDVYATNLGYDYWGLIRGVYRMDNLSGTWVAAMNGIDVNTDYAVYLGMAGNDPEVCYIAGSEPGGKANVLRTADGGQSWHRVFLTAQNQNIYTGYSGDGGDLGWTWGGNILGFTVNPSDADDVLFTDFGFIHRTRDGGTTWHQAYLKAGDENPKGAVTPKKKTYHGVGMEQTTAWQVYWFDPETMFGCFTDIRGIRSTDGGNGWSFDYSGHDHNTMYRIAKHPVKPIWFGATSSVHDIYQTTYITDQRLFPSYRDGRILWSSDKGHSWTVMKDFDTPVIWVETDPAHPNRLYAGVLSLNPAIGGIWQADGTNDPANATWIKLPNPPANAGRIFNILALNDGTLVSTWSARKSNSGSVFSDSSGVFVSLDGGQTWEDRSHPGMAYWTKDLVVDPADPDQNTWFACVWSGWGGPANDLGRLFRTTDRGQSWNPMTQAGQFHRISSVTVDPLDAETLYLTTEGEGLWVTHDKSSPSPAWSLVMAYPFGHPERIFFNPYDPAEIWVASFGNGMRTGRTDVSGSFEPLPESRLVSIPGFPIPGDLQVRILTDAPLVLSLVDAAGRTLVTRKSTGLRTVAFHLPLAGTYWLVAESTGNGQREVHGFTVIP